MFCLILVVRVCCYLSHILPFYQTSSDGADLEVGTMYTTSSGRAEEWWDRNMTDETTASAAPPARMGTRSTPVPVRPTRATAREAPPVRQISLDGMQAINATLRSLHDDFLSEVSLCYFERVNLFLT